MEPGDIGENAAASQIASIIQGDGVTVSKPFTGRVNLIARSDGLLKLNQKVIESLNLVDESVTVATISHYARVSENQIVATIKIIPFAVHEDVIARCEAVLSKVKKALDVIPFKTKRIALIQTVSEGLKKSVLDKTAAVTRDRVEKLGFRLIDDIRVPHLPNEVAAALNLSLKKEIDICLIAGASAITDRRDTVPTGINEAGGKIIHFGMPVDPGNLLLFGEIGRMVAIGLPGCARSPKFNGIDLILNRLAAEIPVRSRDIMLLGAGGLLTDIAERPMPRNKMRERKNVCKIAGLVLAAGQSRRMGSKNKLLAKIDGVSMVRRTVTNVLSSLAEPVIVVTGHESKKVLGKLQDLSVTTIFNAEYKKGLSSSLQTALLALPPKIDGALVCLGDMPHIGADIINQIITAFNPTESREICVPTWEGKRGNPIVLSSRFFNEIKNISGDVGARSLLGQYREVVFEVEVSSKSVLIDIDTPKSLEKAQCYL